MHLVAPTHPSFFWVVCHPSRTSPPKEYKRECQNRLSLLPSARLYPLLPLTHDPPLLYWLGTGWWCLGLAHASLPVYAKSLSAAHVPTVVWRLICAFCRLSLTSYDVNCFLIFHSLLTCSFQALGLAWLWVFPLLTHSLLLPQSCCHSYHTTLLFLSWCHLTRACWASLGLMPILLSMT